MAETVKSARRGLQALAANKEIRRPSVSTTAYPARIKKKLAGFSMVVSYFGSTRGHAFFNDA